jgi:RNA polymerase sigma factor (sigma-70 family)
MLTTQKRHSILPLVNRETRLPRAGREGTEIVTASAQQPTTTLPRETARERMRNEAHTLYLKSRGVGFRARRAYREMLTLMSGMIDAQAREFTRSSIHNTHTFEDFQQIGMEFLLKAYNDFEESRGMTFPSYAYIRVRWGMIRYLQESGVVRLPHRLAQSISSDLRNGKALDAEQIKALSSLTPINGGAEGADVFTDMPSLDHDEMPDTAEVSRVMERADLTDRQREVVMRKYGLGPYPAQNNREITEVLGISTSAFYREYYEALDAMADELGAPRPSIARDANRKAARREEWVVAG